MPIPESLKPILKLTLPVLLIGCFAGILGAVLSGTYLIRYSSSLQQSDVNAQQFSGTKPRPLPGSVEEALANARRSAAPTLVLFYARSTDGTVIPGSEKGAGVVVTSDGWVATTSEVIPDGGLGFSARVGDAVYAVDTVHQDPLTHLTMVHLTSASSLPVVPFGDSQGVEGGEAVYVLVGSDAIVPTAVVDPRQILLPTSISNLAEAFTTNLSLADQIILPSSVVVNSSGELIALTLGKTEGAAGGVGALPIHQMLSAIKTLIRSSDLSRAFFGATVTNLSFVSLDTSLTQGLTRGAYVNTVALGFPASLGGLQKGDIITRFADVTLNDQTTLADLIGNHQPGDTVALTVNRAGTEVQLEVELGKQ